MSNTNKQTTWHFIWNHFRSPMRYDWVHAANYKMPKDFQYEDNKFLKIEGITVRVIPSPVPGRRKHRMIVDLKCGRTISAGRMHQHIPACGECQCHFNVTG
jgi:hypothetical protein